MELCDGGGDCGQGKLHERVHLEDHDLKSLLWGEGLVVERLATVALAVAQISVDPEAKMTIE